MADIADGALVGRQLVLTQEFPGREQLVAQDARGRAASSAPILSQAIQIVDREQCFRRDVRVVQQVRTVAGDQNLAVPATLRGGRRAARPPPRGAGPSRVPPSPISFGGERPGRAAERPGTPPSRMPKARRVPSDMAPARKRQGCSWPLTVCRNSMVSWEPNVLASASDTPGTIRDRLLRHQRSRRRQRTAAAHWRHCCRRGAAGRPGRASAWRRSREDSGCRPRSGTGRRKQAETRGCPSAATRNRRSGSVAGTGETEALYHSSRVHVEMVCLGRALPRRECGIPPSCTS